MQQSQSTDATLFEFSARSISSHGHVLWVAESEILKGCMGKGISLLDAVDALRESELRWLKAAKKYNVGIPCQIGEVYENLK